MAAASKLREQVEALLAEVPPERMPEVVRFLRSLLAENDAPRAPSPPAVEVAAGAQTAPELPPDEQRLVESARRSLPPDTAARLAELRAREAAGRLQDGDRHELHALEGRAERIDTERISALLELARRRGVDVHEVMLLVGLESDEERM